MSLAAKRCFNHSAREAVAKCLDCGSFFCRECITEHDARLVCCNCLEAPASEAKTANHLAGQLLTVALSLIGLLVLWLFFFFIATRLLNVEKDAYKESTHRTRRPFVERLV